MRTRGSTLVVQALEDAGARLVFGIPGTHNIELYDALDQSHSVTAVLVTDEQSAGFMADAVSRSSSSVGVVALVPGAGVTHALSGIAEALLDGIPMVVLACGVRRDTGRAYQLHDVDQVALLRPVTKAVLTPESPAGVYAVVRHAFDAALAGTPGPVAVEIPAEFLLLTHDVPDPVAPEPEPLPPEPAVADLEATAALLRAAERPLIYAGYGARACGATLVELAERIGAPVATTIQGKGVFPENHPLWVWNGLGRSAPSFAHEIAESCDAMLAIGCRFSEVGTGSWSFSPPPALVHVDINRDVFNRHAPARLAIEADAAVFVERLLAIAGEPREWGARTEHLAVGHRAVRESRERTRSEHRVTPAVLFDTLQRLAPDAIYTADSGNGTFLAMEHLRLDRPGRFLAPVDYSSMGYSVPAAVAAAFVNPGQDVIGFVGDGALLMTGLEALTASTYGVGPVLCVLRDGELAQIAQFQRTAHGRSSASDVPDYSVESFARTVGAACVTCATDRQVEGAVREALAISRGGRAVFVDVAIDYSQRTYFTAGVVSTTFRHLPWGERLRLLGRAIGRHVKRRLEPDW